MATESGLFVAPGHFYSPLPDPSDAAHEVNRVFASRDRVPAGLKLDDAGMLRLWDEIKGAMASAPFVDSYPRDSPKESRFRYFYLNNFYSYGDALVYFGLLSHYRPKRIVEIGSGFSSALALDAREIFCLDTQLTFIEPYPNVLNSLLRPHDPSKCEIISKKIQRVPLSTFEKLEAGDFVFIDSSHVAKTGSDVCFEIFDILPALRPGVLVHFHDIFWPLEYPKRWVEQGRAWNELHFLRAFLMYNTSFEVLFFNAYFHHRYRDMVVAVNANCARSLGGGLWIKKS